MITIKDIAGSVRFSTEINAGAKGRYSLMKEDCIILPFNTAEPISFGIGDYVDLAGVVDESLGGRLSKIYEVTEIQQPVPDKENGGYSYKLRLDAYYFKWRNKIFRYMPEGHGQEASWSLTATLDVHLGIFLRNLKALGYRYRNRQFIFSIDSTVEVKNVSITYSSTNMLDALTMMAEAFDCEWWVTDNVIHFGRCEFGSPVKIEIFREASSMSRSESGGRYATRIYAFGSDRNLPADYRSSDSSAVVGGVVQRRLMLPADTPYLDAYPGMHKEEAIEAVVVFDGIFPHRVGIMSDVTTYTDTVENEDGTQTTDTFYRYKDAGLEFDEKYILEGQELRITFESGLMNAMTFSVRFNPTTKDKHQWEIVKNEDYGRPLPDASIRPQNGDRYVLFGYDTSFVSDTIIPEAEQELKRTAKKWLERASKDDSTFTVPLYSSWVEENKISRTFDVGQRVNLVNESYFKGGRISRIIGWEFNLDIPYDSPVYTMGESPAYSRLGSLEEKVEALTYKGQTYKGMGGGSYYIIRTNDDTVATDENVYSALRTLAMFLRKDVPETVKYLMTFMKGVHFGDYVAGPVGTGGAVTIDESGNSHAEVDYLSVRKVADFYRLVIAELKHIGGTIVLTPTSMKCGKVEEHETFYRCYFFQDDGKKSVRNDFVVGDQARSQTFNIEEGVYENVRNSYYWRLVVGVGRDYIDLSKTDCDAGSSVPSADDEIVQLGNRDDRTRQNAVVLSSYGEGSPSFIQYSGVNSYSLASAAKTVVSPTYNRFTGEFYFSTGENVQTKIAAVEGKITSEVASVRKEITEKNNILFNSAFTEDTLGWMTTQRFTPFTIGYRYMYVNSHLYTHKESVAGVTSVFGKAALRLLHSSISQKAADYISTPTFDKLRILIVDKDGKPVLDKEGNPQYKEIKEARIFALEFFYRCAESGTFSVSFSGTNTEGFEPFEMFDESMYLTPNSTFEKVTLRGLWNGTGDINISFTGDVFVNSLQLTEDRFADIEYRFGTKIEQTDKLISLNAEEIKKSNKETEEYRAKLEVAAKKIKAEVEARTKKVDKDMATITSNVSSLQVSADSISQSVSSLWYVTNNMSGDITSLSRRQSSLETTADGISARVDAVDAILGEDGTTIKNWAKAEITTSANGLRAEFSQGITDSEDGLKSWTNGQIEASSRGLTASFTEGYNQLEQKYSALSLTVDGLSTAMSNNKASAEKAIKALNDTLAGVQTDISDANGTMATIQSTLSDLGATVGGLDDKYATTTALAQTNAAIAGQAAKWDDLGNLVSAAGFITKADSNTLYAAKDNIISVINQTPEAITIDASKINLNGVVSVGLKTGDSGSRTKIEGNLIQSWNFMDSEWTTIQGDVVEINNSGYNAHIRPHEAYFARSGFGAAFGIRDDGFIKIYAGMWPRDEDALTHQVYLDSHLFLRVKP